MPGITFLSPSVSHPIISHVFEDCLSHEVLFSNTVCLSVSPSTHLYQLRFLYVGCYFIFLFFFGGGEGLYVSDFFVFLWVFLGGIF